MNHARIALLASTILGASFAALSAQAQTMVGLTGDDMLVTIDAGAKKAGKSVKVTGISGKLAGIDVRPADGMLYGLAVDGTIYTIDAASGKATMRSKMDTVLPANVMATVDFNPVADRMRVIGSDGTSLRVNVEDGKTVVDGKLKFAEADANKGAAPMVIAGAYSNAVKGPKETTLYDIDGKLGALLRQVPPNDGILNTIGKLGPSAKSYAFDITTDAAGASTGWLLADGDLHKVDIATGKASMVGKITGLSAPVRDVAALPAS